MDNPVDQAMPQGVLADIAAHLLTLFELVRLGGPVVAILLAMSTVALAIILLKLFQFWSLRIGSRRCTAEALAAYRSGRERDALSLLEGCRNPVARVMEIGIRGQRRPDVSEQTVREEALRVAGESLEGLRSWLRALEIIASLSPLLGLFGTVLGMIDVFHGMAEAGSQVNPAILSGGIWEALLTTAVGLAVAIPVVAIHGWFERIVDRVAAEMESALTQLFTVALYAAEARSGHSGVACAQPAE